MDVWKQLIADFKAAGSVTVLGSVDSAATLALYDGLDVDGFYFTDGILSASGTSVSALGSPLFASGEVIHFLLFRVSPLSKEKQEEGDSINQLLYSANINRSLKIRLMILLILKNAAK